MAGEWTTLPLEDCMAAIIDYRGKSPEKTTFGVPLVTAKIVKGGRIEKPEEFIAEADFDDWMRRGMPKPGDIVMTTEAPLGEVAQLDGRKVALAQRVITLRGKPDVLDNTFLKFLLQSNPVQEELRSRGTGTTVVGIRQSELRKVSLTLPPLAEQKAIAAVLGALDDKIELNRRMNATLEAMARALFQSWFVDFDPVRQNMDAKPAPSPIPEAANLPAGEAGGKWLTYAIECQGGSLYIGQTDNLRRRWKQHVDGKGAEWTKAHPPVALVFWETHDSLEAAVAREAKLKSGSGREWLKQKIAERTSVRLPAGEAGAKLDGRPPAALDPATAALFPDSFQDSPIGHIPTGWEAAELGQIADVIDCLHAKKPERCEAGQLYLQLNNIRDDGLIDITDSFFVSAEDYQKWISRMEAVAGDCVITNVGRVGAVGQIPEGVKAALGRNITGIRCKSEFPFHTFLIECLVSESMREEIRLKTDSGTILDALNVKNIPKLRFTRPSREIAARFEKLTRPLRRRMEQNITESRTLATLRDTLLPKLLSGELLTKSVAQTTEGHPTR